MDVGLTDGAAAWLVWLEREEHVPAHMLDLALRVTGSIVKRLEHETGADNFTDVSPALIQRAFMQHRAEIVRSWAATGVEYVRPLPYFGSANLFLRWLSRRGLVAEMRVESPVATVVLENHSLGDVTVLDREDRIIYATSGLGRLHGLQNSNSLEFLGAHAVDDILPKCERTRVREAIAMVREGHRSENRSWATRTGNRIVSLISDLAIDAEGNELGPLSVLGPWGVRPLRMDQPQQVRGE